MTIASRDANITEDDIEQLIQTLRSICDLPRGKKPGGLVFRDEPEWVVCRIQQNGPMVVIAHSHDLTTLYHQLMLVIRINEERRQWFDDVMGILAHHIMSRSIDECQDDTESRLRTMRDKIHRKLQNVEV